MRLFKYIEFIKEEYKSTERQKEMVKKWMDKRDIVDPDLIDRFFNVYPKLTRKDINSYKNYDDIISEIEKAESWQTAREKKKDLKSDVIKETFGDVTVVLTLTPKASAFYGSGTTWCTSAANTHYHWYAHRLLGVEFYIFDKSRVDNLSKISVHINWGGKYSTIYDADNSPNFGGKLHEYGDLNELFNYLNDIYGTESISNWIGKEFKTSQRDSPKFLSSILKDFINEGELKKMIIKFNYFIDATDRIIDTDDLNTSEQSYIYDNFIDGWIDSYISWFSQLDYSDITKMLDAFYQIRPDIDDHVFLLESIVYFLKDSEIFWNDIENIPFIFEPDDQDWIDNISDMTYISIDDIESNSNELIDFYKKYDISGVELNDRMDKHCDIILDFFGGK